MEDLLAADSDRKISISPSTFSYLAQQGGYVRVVQRVAALMSALTWSYDCQQGSLQGWHVLSATRQC